MAHGVVNLIKVKIKVKIMIKIVDEQGFRSRPSVNMDNDMVRVKLDMPKWKWRELKKYLKNNTEGELE